MENRSPQESQAEKIAAQRALFDKVVRRLGPMSLEELIATACFEREQAGRQGVGGIFGASFELPRIDDKTPGELGINIDHEIVTFNIGAEEGSLPLGTVREIALAQERARQQQPQPPATPPNFSAAS